MNPADSDGRRERTGADPPGDIDDVDIDISADSEARDVMGPSSIRPSTPLLCAHD